MFRSHALGARHTCKCIMQGGSVEGKANCCFKASTNSTKACMMMSGKKLLASSVFTSLQTHPNASWRHP